MPEFIEQKIKGSRPAAAKSPLQDLHDFLQLPEEGREEAAGLAAIKHDGGRISIPPPLFCSQQKSDLYSWGWPRRVRKDVSSRRDTQGSALASLLPARRRPRRSRSSSRRAADPSAPDLDHLLGLVPGEPNQGSRQDEGLSGEAGRFRLGSSFPGLRLSM